MDSIVHCVSESDMTERLSLSLFFTHLLGVDLPPDSEFLAADLVLFPLGQLEVAASLEPEGGPGGQLTT